MIIVDRFIHWILRCQEQSDVPALQTKLRAVKRERDSWMRRFHALVPIGKYSEAPQRTGAREMSEHTKGLLRLRNSSHEAPDDFILIAESGDSLCDCAPGNPYMSDGEAAANAQRMMSCWNALAGYNPEAVREVVEAARKLLVTFHSPESTESDKDNALDTLGDEMAVLDGEG